MPTFMDRLAANPQGSGIYDFGGGQRPAYGDALNLFNQIRDRDMRDFQDKANFMADLSLKQERQRRMFNPEAMSGQEGQPQNVVYKDLDYIPAGQKAELGIRQQGMDIERQRVAQNERLGQGALDIRQQQADLQEKKNQQIHEQKQAELQRKIDETNKKYEDARARLAERSKTDADRIAANKELRDIMEERHRLEMEKKDRDFQEAQRVHDAQIKEMEGRNKRGNKRVTTEVNPEGTKKTVTTQTGNMVTVTGKDGKQYNIPEDKVDDWNENHAGEESDTGEEE